MNNMLVGVARKSRITYRKLKLITLMAVIVTATLICSSTMLIASADNLDVSWTRHKPVIVSSDEISPADLSTATYCKDGQRQQTNVYGVSWPLDVCMTIGETLSFTTYPAYGSQYGPAIRFRNDKQAYPVSSLACSMDLCTYLPQTDTMLMKQHKTNNIVYGLVAYKDFSTRLIRKVDPVSGQTIGYRFDGSSPSYEFKDSNNYFWAVGTIKGSSNGRYAAVELRDKGLGLLNIDDLTMRYITGITHSYGRGADPSVEFAVANSGQFVAETGRNAGLDIFEIIDSCGEALDAARMTKSLNPVANPCQRATIDYGFIDNFSMGSHPELNANGDALSFYATSRSGSSPRKVVLHADGYVGSKLDYLALGDSFSSGEGAIFDSEYLDGTNQGYDKCHISINSYPFVLARMLSFDMSYTKSVACSGATTDDIVGDDSDYWGQGGRMNHYNPMPSKFEKTELQIDAYTSYKPGVAHQSSFVVNTRPKVITIGVGGNDVGFADKLKACLGPDTCFWAGTERGKEQTALEIKGVYYKLVATYTDLHSASPESKVYVIGYPKLIDETGSCGPLISYLLNQDERKFIDEGVIYLNQIVASAARTAGVKYIDITDSLGDGVLCGSDALGAMNAIRFGDDSALIDGLGWLKVIGQESFHPNTLGHAKIAASIMSSVNNMMQYSYCPEDTVVCPDLTLPPEPSSYWIPGIYHDYPSQIKADFISDGATDDIKTITLPSYSLEPGSSVNITVASDPILIGNYVADNQGKVNVTVNLPVDLEPGYHTLHVNGLSYSGANIDLYDVFSYKIPVAQSTISAPDTAGPNISGAIKTETTDHSEDTDHTSGTSRQDDAIADYSDVSGAVSDRTDDGQVMGAHDTRVSPASRVSVATAYKKPNSNTWLVVTITGSLFIVVILVSIKFIRTR